MKKNFILLMIVALCFNVSFAFAIKPYSANPFYWQYKGEPLLLVGGSDTDHLFLWPDLLSHLNDIQSFGGNYPL